MPPNSKNESSDRPRSPSDNDSGKRSELKRLLVVLVVAITIPILLMAPQSQSQSSTEIKKQEEELRDVMRVWSRQLGVTCLTCHDTSNFKSDKLPAFKIGREHMKLTQVLIDNGMDGKKSPKADCFMCHRGKLKPDYKEPPHPLTQ